MLQKLKIIYLSIFIFILYSPISILVINSFNHSIYSVKWEGFTLKWYYKLLKNYTLIEATKNSIFLASISTITTCIIGTIISFSFYRYEYYGRKINYLLIQIMTMFPDIILGISLLFVFMLFNLELGFKTLFISHITLALPFAILIIFSGFQGLDQNLIEAARDLGANDYKILKKLIIPIILPNILAAALITFTLSLDDVLVSYFVSGPEYEILPIKIFALAKIGTKPEVNAICSVILCSSILLIFLSQIILKKNHD